MERSADSAAAGVRLAALRPTRAARGSRATVALPARDGPTHPHLPPGACWRSSLPVTHGDARLPFLHPVPTSHLPIRSCYARQCPPTWAATAARHGCTRSRTYESSCVGAPTRSSTRSLRCGTKRFRPRLSSGPRPAVGTSHHHDWAAQLLAEWRDRVPQRRSLGARDSERMAGVGGHIRVLGVVQSAGPLTGHEGKMQCIIYYPPRRVFDLIEMHPPDSPRSVCDRH